MSRERPSTVDQRAAVDIKLRPENVFTNQLAGVVHDEMSSLLLLLVSSDAKTTRNQVQNALYSHQSEPHVWTGIPLDLVMDDLGRLRELGLIDYSRGGWIRTKDGYNVTALAGSMLDFSLQFPDTSFRDLFELSRGHRVRPDEESDEDLQTKFKKPEKQYQIYKALVENESVLVTDIAETIDQRTDHSRRSIGRLIAKGFVESRERPSHVNHYKLNAQADRSDLDLKEMHPKDAQFVRVVLDFTISHPDEWVSSDQIAQYYLAMRPLLSPDETRKRAARSFHALEENGVLTRQQEAVSLVEDKRNMFSDLVRRIEGFRNNDRLVVNAGMRAAERIVYNPQEFSQLMLKGRETYLRSGGSK